MKKQLEPEFLEAIKKAQMKAIKRWMVNCYAGGGDNRFIGRWNDHKYSMCKFYRVDVMCSLDLSLTSIRKRLKKAVEIGIIKRIQGYKNGPVSYRYDRATCDDLAIKVIEELRAQGLTDDPRGW